MRTDTYKYILTLRTGEQYDVTAGVSNAGRADNANDVAQTMDMQITLPTRMQKDFILGSLQICGARIESFLNGVTRNFTGIIWEPETETYPTDAAQFTCYDPLIYLMKSKDNRFFKKGLACKATMCGLFEELGVPYVYAGPDFIMDSHKYSNNAYAEMCLDFLQEGEKKHNTGKFFIRYDPASGKAQVMARGSNGYAAVLDMDSRGPLKHKATHPEITRIKIVGKDSQNKAAPTLAVIDGDLSYGIIQEIQTIDNTTLAKAKTSAQQDMADRGKVKEQVVFSGCLDAPAIRRGDYIIINDERSALNGKWAVTSITHDQIKKTMDITAEGI